jgi:hypothetical protein
MGLDDFTSEDEYAQGEVKTRKKPENISVEEDEWKWLIIHDPHWAAQLGCQMSLKDAKCMAQMMDEVLAGDETPYGAASDSQKEAIEEQRKELIEYIKGKDD